MTVVTNKIPEMSGLTPSTIKPEVLKATTPMVLRGFVSDWPIVAAAKEGTPAVFSYLQAFSNNANVVVTCGDPSIKGHVSYVDDISRPNVSRQAKPLNWVLDTLLKHVSDESPPLYYVASTAPADCLPGLTEENPMMLDGITPLESIWIGNQSRIPAHYDLPDNIACVAAGSRRFTLFPPDQLANLYVGPVDQTPAGQPISIVDFHNPDFERFPNYQKALDAALSGELEAGDAIYIPSMWWHQVEGLDSFNVLMNYWWRQSPAYMPPPVDALNHAMLAIRDLPPEQKRVWQGIFNHYVFEADEKKVAHIPRKNRGILGGVTEAVARQLRSYLLNRLNR